MSELTNDYRFWSELHDLKDSRIEEYLIETLDTIKNQLINTTDIEKIRVLQGKAQLLFEIMNNIEKAHDKLVDLKKDKTNMSKVF